MNQGSSGDSNSADGPLDARRLPHPSSRHFRESGNPSISPQSKSLDVLAWVKVGQRKGSGSCQVLEHEFPLSTGMAGKTWG